jgi:hypothetical protein
MDCHIKIFKPGLDGVVEADSWAREKADGVIKKLKIKK